MKIPTKTVNDGIVPTVPSLTPETFWSLYRREIEENATWSSYQSDSYWTGVALGAAESACHKFGFKTGREYLKLDVYAWTGDGCDWDIRVAFENENANSWEEELCKLTHIVSDLRVLAAYQLHRNIRPEEMLDQYLVRHRRRIARVRDCKWLFIFGPYYKNRGGHWAAYTLDDSGKRIQLIDEIPLLGTHIKD